MGAPPFENWGRNVRSQPSSWEHPAGEAEVGALVRAVAARGGRVRAVGSGHSWSPIAAPDDVAVDLSALDRMSTFDPDEGTVTVGAGVRLHHLVAMLARNGLALATLGSIAQQQLAGAIATATHGSSLHVGNLSSLVERVVLVDGAGELHEIGSGDPRLPGARVHLGALGLITRITLKVVPHYRLIERRVRMPVHDALAAFVPAAREHAFAKVWWLPGCAEALLITYDPTEDPADPSELARVIDRAANRWAFPAVLAIGKRCPNRIPANNRLVDAIHFRSATRTGPYDELLTLTMPPRHQESERAFGVRHTAEALGAFVREVERQRFRLDFIMEMRLVKGDDAWLSPAYGGDVCQVGVYATHSPDLPAATAAFDEILAPFGARPHWGKSTNIDWAGVQRVWPKAKAFRDLALELDPRGTFRNTFIDRVLGPVA